MTTWLAAAMLRNSSIVTCTETPVPTSAFAVKLFCVVIILVCRVLDAIQAAWLLFCVGGCEYFCFNSFNTTEHTHTKHQVSSVYSFQIVKVEIIGRKQLSKMCLKLWTKTHTQSRCPKGCLKVCRKVSCPRQNTHTLITITLPIGVWLITYSLSVSTDTGYGYVYHGVGTAGNAMQYVANQTYCVQRSGHLGLV